MLAPSPRTVLALTVALTAAVLPSAATAGTPGSPAAATIATVSTRADLASGGDALVEVRLPLGADGPTLRVTDDGRDVSRGFKPLAHRRFLGLVTGLSLGRNVLQVSARGATPARLVVTNHPNGGPVFSGPQLGSWACQPTARTAQCDEPARYSYLYRSTDPTAAGLQPYDLTDARTDVATTTTDQGVTVPFIVRREDGYANRDRYTIMALFQPGQRWTATYPQKQWNRKLHVPGGGGCGNARTPGTPPLLDNSGTVPASSAQTQTYELALGRGFAVGSAALLNLGHDCNPVVMAEALMMLQERLIEQYGELRYTIGSGCSGGSIVQQWVANSYPGLYDGLTIGCSYPDVASPLMQFADYHLLRAYLEQPGRWAPGVAWTERQMAAVAGHAAYLNVPVADTAFVAPIVDPTTASCPGVKAEEKYDSARRPGGVRCGLMDYNVNAFGTRPAAVWTAEEKAAGRGFAGQPSTTSGCSTGCGAAAGPIPPEQFVDLNAKLGGMSVDMQLQPQRMVADRGALSRRLPQQHAQHGGRPRHRAGPAHRRPGPGRGPRRARTRSGCARGSTASGAPRQPRHVGRARAAGGRSQLRLPGLPRHGPLAHRDRGDRSTRAAPLARQGRRRRQARPTSTTGAPTATAGNCRQHLPVSAGWHFAHAVAGQQVTADTLKCALRPLARGDDYGLVPFTDEQWTAVQALFPSGVCDYAKPGVGEQHGLTWATYGSARQHVYGGRPLPTAPVSVPVR